jgi:hypothetical protein
MKSWTRKLFVAIAVMAAFLPVHAQNGTGGMPGSYLYMGVGARALGMGGAYSAVANDATAVYWNPAGLAQMNPYQVSFMHAVLFMDSSFDFIGATAPTEHWGNFGAAMLSLTSGDFEQRTALNEEVGTFSTRDMAVLFSWSKHFFDRISVGLNYKLVTQKILNHSGSGHGIDLGVKAPLVENISAGVVLRNLLTPKVTLAESPQTYPMQIGIGIARAVFDDQFLLSAEFSRISGWGNPQLSIGGEYRFMERMALRFGVNSRSITFGAGFSFDSFGVGYSNVGNVDLGASHRFSLDYAFGGFGVGAAASPEVFSPAGELNITHIKLKVKTRERAESWFFAIIDSEGETIRQFRQSGTPPDEIVWDGRDTMGQLVHDGKFSYLLDVRTAKGENLTVEGNLVSIDSSGPDGVFSMSEGD